MGDGREATMVGIRGIRALIEQLSPAGRALSNVGILGQRVAQDGIGYGPAVAAARGIHTPPSLLTCGGHADPTGFFSLLLLSAVMIDTIEDAFGTPDHHDRQDKANGASQGAGIRVAEATQDTPGRHESANLHAAES